jgi:hypothetical protein
MAKACSQVFEYQVFSNAADDAQFAQGPQEQWMYSREPGIRPTPIGESIVYALEPFFDLTRFLNANRCPLRLKTL